MSTLLHNALKFKEEVGMLSDITMEELNREIDDIALESADAAFSMEQDTIIMEECISAATSLEEIIESMEDMRASGEEISKFTAEGYYHAVKGVVGEQYAQEIFQGVSLESVGDNPGIVIDEFTMEQAKGVLSKLWSGAKNAAARLSQGTGDVMKRVFGGFGSLRKKMRKLQSELNGIGTKAKFKKDILKVKGGSRLHVGGSMEVKDVAEGLRNGSGIIKELHTTYGNITGNILEVINDVADKASELAKQAEENDEKLDKKAVKDVKREYGNRLTEVVGEGFSNLSGYHGTRLPGGRIFYSPRGIQIDFINGITSDTMLLPRVVDDNSLGEYDDSEAVKAPTPKEIEELAEALVPFVNAIGNLEKEFDQYIGKIGEAAGTIYQMSRDQGDMRIIGQIKSALMVNNINQITTALEIGARYTLDYQFSVSRAGLNYLQRAINNF